jgi:hypothetical protein
MFTCFSLFTPSPLEEIIVTIPLDINNHLQDESKFQRPVTFYTVFIYDVRVLNMFRNLKNRTNLDEVLKLIDNNTSFLKYFSSSITVGAVSKYKGLESYKKMDIHSAVGVFCVVALPSDNYDSEFILIGEVPSGAKIVALDIEGNHVSNKHLKITNL